MIDLSGRRGEFRFRSDLEGADRYVFAVDLYSHLRESHPETHVGYWVFPLPVGEGDCTVEIDLDPIRRESLTLTGPHCRHAAIDSW